MTSSYSAVPEDKKDLPRPGRIGIAARVALALGFFGGAVAAQRLLPPALALGAAGALLALAALARQPGCEVNLVWTRLFGRRPIDCFVFGPLDRWERRWTGSPR
jgi:hypothetical protein